MFDKDNRTRKYHSLVSPRNRQLKGIRAIRQVFGTRSRYWRMKARDFERLHFAMEVNDYF